MRVPEHDLSAKEREALVNKARSLYGTDDLEIDGDAKVSLGENGAWIAAWVFVPKEEPCVN